MFPDLFYTYGLLLHSNKLKIFLFIKNIMETLAFNLFLIYEEATIKTNLKYTEHNLFLIYGNISF